MSHTKGKKGLEFETVMSVVPYYGSFSQPFGKLQNSIIPRLHPDRMNHESQKWGRARCIFKKLPDDSGAQCGDLEAGDECSAQEAWREGGWG